MARYQHVCQHCESTDLALISRKKRLSEQEEQFIRELSALCERAEVGVSLLRLHCKRCGAKLFNCVVTALDTLVKEMQWPSELASEIPQ